MDNELNVKKLFRKINMLTCEQLGEKYQEQLNLLKKFRENFIHRQDSTHRKTCAKLATECFNSSNELVFALRLDFFEKNHPDWPLQRKWGLGALSVFSQTVLPAPLLSFRVLDEGFLCSHKHNQQFKGGSNGIEEEYATMFALYPKTGGDVSGDTVYISKDNATTYWGGKKVVAAICNPGTDISFLCKHKGGGFELKQLPEKKRIKGLKFISETTVVVLTDDLEVSFYSIPETGGVICLKKQKLKNPEDVFPVGFDVCPDGTILLRFFVSGEIEVKPDLVGNYSTPIITKNEKPRMRSSMYPRFSSQKKDERLPPPEIIKWGENEPYKIKAVLPSGRLVGVVRTGRGVSSHDSVRIFSDEKHAGVYESIADCVLIKYYGARELTDGTILLNSNTAVYEIIFEQSGLKAPSCKVMRAQGQYELTENNELYCLDGRGISGYRKVAPVA